MVEFFRRLLGLPRAAPVIGSDRGSWCGYIGCYKREITEIAGEIAEKRGFPIGVRFISESYTVEFYTGLGETLAQIKVWGECGCAYAMRVSSSLSADELKLFERLHLHLSCEPLPGLSIAA